jgi:tetratricopeptide (TPR) repeat protein
MRFWLALPLALVLCCAVAAQEAHDHGVPEQLGKVSFPTSCSPAVQPEFERAVALLHSFAYSAAETAFREVARKDAHCAIAHWGIAMSYFRQLWDPPIYASNLSKGHEEIVRAQQITQVNERERGFISTVANMYPADEKIPYASKIDAYVAAMQKVAAQNAKDVEAQVFYALSLLAAASPSDKTHAKQKQAVAVLQPLYAQHPEHPGLAHYLIHATDNAEMAREGLPAAQAYAKIAPSAPHALHMPSHIFTRLGMWDDSIKSNVAAKASAKQHGDIGEELHAMDYLVYAYLQNGQDSEAAEVIAELKSMPELNTADAKVGYAATAMPVRYAVERKQWADAAGIVPPPSSAPPHVIAIAVWARGLGLAHTGHPAEARAEAAKLEQLKQQLHSTGRDYWAGQVDIQRIEVLAWAAQAEGKPDEALALLRQAADTEDAVEKSPATPGPVVPAREQLGDLLLQTNHPQTALKEYQSALVNAPGRRGATMGAARATQLSDVAEKSHDSSMPR